MPYAPGSPFSYSSKDQPKIVGLASTLKLIAKASTVKALSDDDPGTIPKGGHWVDMTEQGTVVVIEQPDGQTCAAVGGIMAARMKLRGVFACVVDGRVRDLEELRESELPVSTSLDDFSQCSEEIQIPSADNS